MDLLFKRRKSRDSRSYSKNTVNVNKTGIGLMTDVVAKLGLRKGDFANLGFQKGKLSLFYYVGEHPDFFMLTSQSKSHKSLSFSLISKNYPTLLEYVGRYTVGRVEKIEGGVMVAELIKYIQS